MMYKVKTGDTLWDIAENELGDGFRYKEIMKLNDFSTDIIKPGEILILPGEPGEPETPADGHYEKLGKLFEIAMHDIGCLPAVIALRKELEEG